MRAYRLSLIFAVLVAASTAAAVEVSVKNNVGGHFEYAGFTIVPIADLVPVRADDLSAARAFEIIRPYQQAITVGRLYTSCTCIQAEIEKKDFGYGERAIITLRNVQPTQGQNYPFYVQINSPLRVVLRHDTFVISDQFLEAVAGEAVAGEAVADEAVAADSTETANTADSETATEVDMPAENAETADADDEARKTAEEQAAPAETNETDDAAGNDAAPSTKEESPAPLSTAAEPPADESAAPALPLADDDSDNAAPPPAVPESESAPVESDHFLSDKDLVGS